MKILCSQEFVSPHLWGLSPIRSLRRRLHPQTPWCVPWLVARFALMGQDLPVLVYFLQCRGEGHTCCLREAGGYGQGTRAKKASGVYPSARGSMRGDKGCRHHY